MAVPAGPRAVGARPRSLPCKGHSSERGVCPARHAAVTSVRSVPLTPIPIAHMLSRLIPRDEQFFDLFNQLAGHLKTSAQLLEQLFVDPSRTADLVAKIKEVEHIADQLTLSISTRIDRSFITPIDREDIHLLASRLDDVIDRLDGTARRVVMLHINEVRAPARQMASVLVRAADHIAQSVG